MSEQTFSEEDGGRRRSQIACHVCRKRKVKCDREIPRCSLCLQSFQHCEYPEKPLRPGPKIGSTQNPRKRKSAGSHVENERLQERMALSKSPPLRPDLPEMAEIRASSEAAGSPERTSAAVAAAPAPATAGDIQALSFIIHPSHEACSPEQVGSDSPGSARLSQQESQVRASCLFLGVNPELLEHYIDLFFDNFTSFQLFRPTDIWKVLHSIESPNQCRALLAAILLFATKYQSDGEDDMVPDTAVPDHSSSGLPPQQSSSAQLLAHALRLMDLSFYECEDEPISFPLLQALILLTHWLLIQGVRGRAWRYLRVAIGCAYELHLHLIDAGHCEGHEIDPERWCEDEGRRRMWWAIWEMDVFASVIRRCPTGIDWSQNETFLPAEDERWYASVPQPSCKLQLDLLGRYKALEATGNRSPRAWFIVANSLMKDAQKITSPMGLDKKAPRANDPAAVDDATTRSKEALIRLRTISNALHCTSMALPRAYKYRQQHLDFGTRELDSPSMRQRRLHHSFIYSIHAMTQLARLMVFKYYLFHNGHGAFFPTDHRRQSASRHQALEQYSECADEIVSLVGRSYDEHYKYINPYLANTIWLAGAVQLLYREVAPLDPSDKGLANSKLEVLGITYNKFVRHWHMSTTLQRNLVVVEAEIHNLRPDATRGNKPGGNSRVAPKRPPISKGPLHEPSAEIRTFQNNASPMGHRIPRPWPGPTGAQGDRTSQVADPPVADPPVPDNNTTGAGVPRDTTIPQRRAWSSANANTSALGRYEHTYHSQAAAQFGSLEGGMLSSPSHGRHITNANGRGDILTFTSSNVGPVSGMASTSTMAPTGSQGFEPVQQGALPLFTGTDVGQELSPTFFAEDSAGVSVDLTHYFGDILSGGFIP